jgi:hypothetical protein
MKRSLIFKIIIFAITVFLFSSAVSWWTGRGDGFALYKIQSSPLYESRWDINYTQEDLQLAQEALKQKYRYLGHGFQCYAFVSEDDKYVLKFFRHQRLRLPDFVNQIPSFPIFEQWRKTKRLSLARRKDYLLRSCKTSWTLAKDQTQLLMVHLNLTKALFPTITIIDPLSQSHTIPLDNYQFMLQRKALQIKPTIAALMKAQDLDGAKARLDQIFDLFVFCAHKGIQDTDGALIRKNNLGFFNDKAIYIDGGKLQPRAYPITKKAFKRDLKRLYLLEKWITLEYPALHEHFKEAKARAIVQIEPREVLCTN